MDRASQLLGRERHVQDVVHTEIERLELGPQVAAAGQAQDRRRHPGQAVRGPDPPEQGGAVVVVHVDRGQVEGPVAQDRVRPRESARGPDHEDAVVQRQRDEVCDQRAIVEHECSARFD
jgi:hypothetical protein